MVCPCRRLEDLNSFMLGFNVQVCSQIVPGKEAFDKFCWEENIIASLVDGPWCLCSPGLSPLQHSGLLGSEELGI